VLLFVIFLCSLWSLGLFFGVAQFLSGGVVVCCLELCWVGDAFDFFEFGYVLGCVEVCVKG